MTEYHKINTLFKRDMDKPGKPLIIGEWVDPVYQYLASNEWEYTEKVDGTNIRVIVGADRTLTFAGKTDNASIPAPLLKKLQERFLPQAESLFSAFQEGACLYGEGYGPKIQNGGKYIDEQDFVLFDVLVGKWWLSRNVVEEIADMYDLCAVPVIGFGTLHQAINEVATGFDSQWGDFTAEGIVARPKVALQSRSGERIITKIKHRDFKSAI